MYQLIENFINDAKEMDDDIFPFMANKDWKEGKPVYYSGPYWDDHEARELVYSIMKGKWLSSGEKVNKFEREFSSKFGFEHSVMVNSGSSANLVMIAALKKYFNWRDDDEIIVCACGFATTVAPIVQAGLKPVFVFYPAHHLCTIEGGMVSSNIKGVVDLARSFAWWGRGCYCVGQQNLLPNGVCGKRFDKWLDKYDDIVDHKYVFSNMGYNLKPLDLQGAVGSVQLLKFEEIHDKRRRNKWRIQQIVERIPGIRVMNEMPNAETSWFGVPILCENKKLKHPLVRHFEKNKIQTRNYFAGNILLHPGYSHLDDANKYPNANQVLDLVFFLGCSPTITDEMIDYISKVSSEYVSD